MNDEHFRKKCFIWVMWFDDKVKENTDISPLADAHSRFIKHVYALAMNTKDTAKKEQLKETMLEYIEVFHQCYPDIRKAHEILCNRYDYKNEKEETK